jgi:pyruvate dehydrogenase E2 component (dihydrolipoamide acetyltransferase)
VPSDSVDLCVAVSLRRGGLLTPAIPAADTLDLDQMMATLRDLVRRTRSGGLRGSEMAGGSATVTNLGDLGVDTVHGIISPPQIALVGFGRPARRPWVVDDAVVPRDLVDVTLAADHRQSDGLSGSRFLATVAQRLEHPEEP